MAIERLWRDERGFTSAGMAVALLVSLSLLFSAAQVYRINTVAAEVQEVADAAAMAAENQVAEFMVAARVCDAVVFSLTVTGDVAYGLGVVALCVPPAAEVGAQLVSAGQKILKARDACADKAAEALNALQRALPFAAAARGAAVAAANGDNRSSAYLALALLLPGTAEEVVVGEGEAEEALEQAVDERRDILEEAAQEAERAARAADEAKARGFARDCGDNPSYCLYERASRLGALGSDENPLYVSADSWSFAAPLERARAYYPARLLSERPASDSVEDKAKSALRKRFYAFAVRELRKGYVRETENTFEAYFPSLPRNADEMRGTDLYTEPVYPVTVEEGVSVMHAWDGCTEAGLVDSYGSVKTMEEGNFPVCPACQFSASALGSVASASTSIDNGFEYHYAAIAEAAADYQKARAEAAPAAQAVKEEATGLLDKVAAALRDAGSFRIEVSPPGADGCLAVVVSPGVADAGPLACAFAAGGSLGPRVAVSGATLIEDGDDEASVVGDLLDGLVADEVGLAGVGSMVLNCWGSLLDSYEQGWDGLMTGVEEVLGGLPLVGSSGLGSWAADALRESLGAVGLEPASTAPLKPVLASSVGVARASGGDYAERFVALHDQVMADPSASGGFSLLGGALGREAYDALAGGEVTIAEIELPFAGFSVPVTIALPPAVAAGAAGLVEQAMAAIDAVTGSSGGGRLWE